MKASSIGIIVGIALEDFDDERMYSDTYINQFADDLVTPIYVPIESMDDERIDEHCYRPNGKVSRCIPLTALTTEEKLAEANILLLDKTTEEAIKDLQFVDSLEEELTPDTDVYVGQVVMFVNLQERFIDEVHLAQLNGLFATSSVATVGDNENETLFDRLVLLANNFIDGVLSVFEVRADRLEVTQTLCVENVCINADDMRALINSAEGTYIVDEPTPEIDVVPTPPIVVSPPTTPTSTPSTTTEVGTTTENIVIEEELVVTGIPTPKLMPKLVKELLL